MFNLKGLVIYELVCNLGCFFNGHDLGIGFFVLKGHVNIKLMSSLKDD